VINAHEKTLLMTPQNIGFIMAQYGRKMNSPKPFSQSLHSEIQQKLSNSF
jgi:hypothetical protein